ncbi:Scr1 family TA system antitoxin-like transcriptional regulator [Streptomyces formicae]
MTFEPEQLGQSTEELAVLLKGLRKGAGLSGDRLAKRMNVSQSKVSRIENAKAQPSLVDVEQWLRATAASPEAADRIMTLARLANTQWRDLRSLRRTGLGSRQAELKALEASSVHMRYFLLSMITGLLATPDYARASLSHSPADTSKAVAGKLERQQVLHDASKRFTFLITEQAARFPLIKRHAMAMQLDHLASLTYLPNVRLGVIPVGTFLPGTPLNTFTAYDDRMVTAELTTGSIVFRDARDIRTYLDDFAGYEAQTLFDDAARAKLGEWSATCRSDL